MQARQRSPIEVTAVGELEVSSNKGKESKYCILIQLAHKQDAKLFFLASMVTNQAVETARAQ